MASHQLAIAKASFSAGLLRPDPTSLSRDDIAHFHSLLNSVILQCSPENVQICKQWILENIVQSAARFTALGKYLTSLTAAFTEGGRKDVAIREPSVKRKRLHVLYLVNDILHHSRHRSNDASICGKVQPILVSLFGSVSSFKDCPKHQGKVSDLLDIWEEKSYYSKDYIDKLREAVKNASDAGEHVDGSSDRKEEGLPVKNAKSAPYVMPAMHGDASTPWFDLPAGNLMPHIVPNSTRPINPDMIKPLQFVAGPAEEGLTQAVKALLEDVQAIYGENNDEEEKASLDIDELGQVIVVDEITGDIIEGEGYYGWSRTFCEKMKRRKKGIDVPSRAGARDQRSQSRSSSPGMRKRRYSQSSDSSDMGGSRAARRRRSYSSSRSPSPDGKRNAHARPRSRSITFSPSPPPPPPSSEPRNTSGPNSFQGPPPPPPNNFGPRPPMPPMSQPPFQQGFNPNFPIPPPPPHQMPWNGQQQQYPAWIPPPPQPMQNMSFNAQAQLHNPHQHFNPQNQQYPQNQQQYGSWPPPPPPPGPPPPNYQQQGQYPPGPGSGQQQQGNGRGYNNTPPNNNGWNNAPRGGRGGYRGGRGW